MACMLLSKYSNNDTHCVSGVFCKESYSSFWGYYLLLGFWLRLHFSLYFSVKSSNVFCTFWWLFKLAALFSLPFLKWTTKTCRCIHLLQNGIARLLCWGIQASPSFFSVVHTSSKTYVLLESDAMQFFINILPSHWSTFSFLCTLLQIGGFSFIYARFSLISLLTEKRCLLRVVCLNLVENFTGLLFT